MSNDIVLLVVQCMLNHRKQKEGMYYDTALA